MPGYVIHLAVGKVYSKNNKINDLESFEKGIMAPDMEEDKSKSHYGPYSSSPGIKEFLELKGISDSYNEGYFLHLLTDYLFYNKFLDKWEKSIYDDYDIINQNIIKKYGIEIPKEIQEKVKFKQGILSILNEEDIYKFIEFVGKLNIRQIISKKGSKIEEWDFEEK